MFDFRFTFVGFDSEIHIFVGDCSDEQVALETIDDARLINLGVVAPALAMTRCYTGFIEVGDYPFWDRNEVGYSA
jgi:hypothetical protein